MTWLSNYAAAIAKSDQLVKSSEHVELLAAGLLGEAGSILSEIKKEHRDQLPAAVRTSQLLEEIGDFLWYYVRLASCLAPNLPQTLNPQPAAISPDVKPNLNAFLKFGAAVADLFAAIVENRQGRLGLFGQVWDSLAQACTEAGLSLQEAASANLERVESRWPVVRQHIPLFDEAFPDDEQLPRRLLIEFRETSKGSRRSVSLRWNGVKIGDHLTDNIRDPDGYRFHDIFHFANMVHLGWSPIARRMLRVKRKSSPQMDEAEDGARAAITEEAIAALVFSRAKHLRFYEGLCRVDYDLLKTIQILTKGYEVDAAPLWQWEESILDGYRLFRELRNHEGGVVAIDLSDRRINYSAAELKESAIW